MNITVTGQHDGITNMIPDSSFDFIFPDDNSYAYYLNYYLEYEDSDTLNCIFTTVTKAEFHTPTGDGCHDMTTCSNEVLRFDVEPGNGEYAIIMSDGTSRY